MSTNIELKARCADIERARTAALSLGDVTRERELQRDSYFGRIDGRLKLRERSKIVDDKTIDIESQLIWYSRSNTNEPRPSDYRLLELEHPESCRRWLGGTLGIVVTVDKDREIILWNRVRIHLDEVHGLGKFIELEAIVDEQCDERAAYEKIDYLIGVLNIDRAGICRQSYSDMLVEQAASR